MSQSCTPSKPRIAGQLSGSGTIASEDSLFKDETSGCEFYIPFAHFANAFLQSTPADAAVAQAYQDSPNFKALYDSFSTSASASNYESSSVYAPLVELMNHVLDSERARVHTPSALPLRFDYLSSAGGIWGEWSFRKPDIVGVQGPLLSWTGVLVACEYKRGFPTKSQLNARISTNSLTQPSGSTSHSQSQTSGLSVPPSSRTKHGLPKQQTKRDLQLARYLLEMRSHQVTRDAVFGIFFLGDTASFWYADSDSTIKSKYVPLDSLEFITALICLARADAILLGYSPRFRANGAVLTSDAVQDAELIWSPDINSPNAEVYSLHDVISVARALHGRCSRVLGSTSLDKDLAIKLSYQVVTRISEADMIKRAHERKISGVVELLFSIDLHKLSGGPRSRLPPDLIPGARSDLLVEDRVLRLIVLPRCTPLYKVLNAQHFLMACISLLKSRSLLPLQ
jgi:hypothetical protein